MITPPHIINAVSFQDAWFEASSFLSENEWEYYNLIVHIQDPTLLSTTKHELYNDFTQYVGILTAKQVAYTIFPYNQYKGQGTSNEFYYNYINKFYPRIKTSWGNYFYRMVNYGSGPEFINQLDNIITAINTRTTRSKAAYTIVFQNPGNETIRRMGGPCLNYLAIQINRIPHETLGLMAIYRNHDFLERAYGNYFGLCKLLGFIATETNMNIGPITCISSHAFINSNKYHFKRLIEDINEIP